MRFMPNTTSILQKSGSCQIIETETELCRMAERMAQKTCIAVDLEADSMFHFREKVCLLQVATEHHSFVIDPLKIVHLDALKPVFSDPGIRKIFHGADFDVRSLHRDFGIEIHNLFDTELASRFLGIRESGLGAVLRDRFGIQLDKRYQRKNWSQRPLPEGMLEYAASDVIYLHDLADMLTTELQTKHRDTWVREECEHLSQVRHSPPDMEPLFMKFKGAGRLQPLSLAVLEGLLEFRMELAEKKDKPLFKVFSNAALMELATEKPRTLEALKKMKSLSSRQVAVYGERLLCIINQAFQIPPKALPKYLRKTRPKPDRSILKRVNALKAWRDRYAEKLDLDPSLLFNKAHLTAIAGENPRDEAALQQIDGLKNWQCAEFGAAVIHVLSPFND
jgi:ribonuclease D